MTDDLDAFVDQFLAPERPPRGSGGRPLLIPRGVEVSDANRVPYTRASSLADVLEDHLFLWKWKIRGAVKGVADRLDLARLIAAEPYTCGFAEDEMANKQAGRNIDAVIERAMDHAGIDMKADYGTAIHLRTEPGNVEHDLDEKQDADVQATWDLWAKMGVVHLATEVFTANDTIRAAGTLDHLSYVPGVGIVITDKKTSSKAKSNYDVQLADYANSDVYDVETDTRMTFEEYIASLGWDPALFRRDVGLVWWVKNGKCEARWLDLTFGWKWAQIAAEILSERRPASNRVAKNMTSALLKGAEEQRTRLLAAIEAAADEPTLIAIWNNPAAKAIWTEAHTAAATARKGAL